MLRTKPNHLSTSQSAANVAAESSRREGGRFIFTGLGGLLGLTLLTGCLDTKVTLANGATLERRAFLNKTAFGRVEFHSGTNSAVLENYASDQMTGAAQIAREALRGAVEGMKGTP